MAHPLHQLTPSGSGLKPRRKHGVISRLPSHKPLFCAFTACKIRLLSNARLLTQGLEPLCFRLGSQLVLHPEPLLKPRPGTLRSRSSWPLCLRARSLTSTSLGVMLCMWRPTISLWKKSLRRAFVMLRQSFSGCYCDFNATISRSSTTKIPSCSSRICSAVIIIIVIKENLR